MRRALFFGAIIAIASILADFVIYQKLVVPRLGNWRSVPIYWWAIVHSPVMIAIMIMASRLTEAKHILLASGTAAALCTLYHAWAAETHQPGYGKSVATEAPLFFWISTPLILLFTFGFLAAMVRVVHNARR